MHEVSFGTTIRDYLTDAEIEETTYEEFRQALARMLVEEKDYPREVLTPKVDVPYCIEGETLCRTVDLVARDGEGRAVLLAMFCAGEVGSYDRESISAARLFPDNPVPLVLVTDTREALLLDTRTGEKLGSSMRAVPAWQELLELAADRPMEPLTGVRRQREERILHTYTGFLKTCCTESCPVK